MIEQNVAGAPPLDCWFDEHDEGTDRHDVWTLTTQPSKLAHYAMWPPKLAERLILMMCPLEVCSICGQPRRRIERPTDAYTAQRGGSGDFSRHRRGQSDLVEGSAARSNVSGLAAQNETIGWTDCGCYCLKCNGTGLAWDGTYAADGHERKESCTCSWPNRFVPGVVLDPFAGTGTSLNVAELHGRDSIGIDIDARNEQLVDARMIECKRTLFGTAPELPGQGALAL